MPAVVTQTPADYDELFELYGDYVAGLVRRQGFPPQEAEDVAQEILLAEFRSGVLEMYDPEHTVEHQGTLKKCTFRAFLSARVVLRCKGQRDKIARRASRELLLCDGAVDDSGTKWIELFGGAQWDDYSQLDASEFVTRMRSYLARVPRRSALDNCDLVALFDELVSQVRDNGEITACRVADRFGVTDATIGAWIGRLREVMTGAGELPAPEKHEVEGVPLSLPDIRRAIEVLKSSKGIMVKQPLARAGHPLAMAPDGWYHRLSAEERKAYPEIEVDNQTHRKPADHVKRAVIHALERMLGMSMADAPAPSDVIAAVPEPGSAPAPPQCPPGAMKTRKPEPDSEPTVLEIIESKLFRLGVAPAGVDEILELCSQL
jgi:hypothetical protein